MELTLDAVIATLPAARRRAVAMRAADLIDKELSLRDGRKPRQLAREDRNGRGRGTEGLEGEETELTTSAWKPFGSRL